MAHLPWKKINSNPRFTLIEKVNKKRQESGCGRHSNVDLWQGQVITNAVHMQDLSTS